MTIGSDWHLPGSRGASDRFGRNRQTRRGRADHHGDSSGEPAVPGTTS